MDTKPLGPKRYGAKIRIDDVSISIVPLNIVSRITNIVQLILFIVDSGCTKHMTGNLKLLCNFMEKFLGQFCDADFEVAFRKSTCFVRDLQGNDLLTDTHAYLKEEGIEHQTSTPRTPEQNGRFERQNRTLFEAARTMLSASKLPLPFWLNAVATAKWPILKTRSINISALGKMRTHHNRQETFNNTSSHLCCICYNKLLDGENLDKMKEKGDPCVMVGYSTQSKGYHVYNKQTRLIVESIHIKFDEIIEMMSDHNSSDLAPQRQVMSVENVTSGLVTQGQKASDYDNSDPVPPRQNVVPTAEKTDSSQQGLEFLFSPLLEEYYNPAHGHAEDNNNDQAPNALFQEAKFINPFCIRVQEIDHPLEQIRGNPTMPVQTRRQLDTDPKICMFALTVSIVEPKNIKEAMTDSAWIEAMQDELHQFDRLKVWELVDKPFGKMIIKLKWLWKNKKDEDQTVIRNKARLVAKGYAQEEGIDLEEILSIPGLSTFVFERLVDYSEANSVE
ncbi:retrovirus-related pol polyprotein from transposon TNT 1-94 [Tanacetum coccineum]|uniref:Retrovirus-related pol polyprotein from transposon TNT 1-94 n=1 Tax=Tanacetum coccineum TaxID=301880 RepID=A0ABQ4ZNH7_9ASTR